MQKQLKKLREDYHLLAESRERRNNLMDGINAC